MAAPGLPPGAWARQVKLVTRVASEGDAGFDLAGFNPAVPSIVRAYDAPTAYLDADARDTRRDLASAAETLDFGQPVTVVPA